MEKHKCEECSKKFVPKRKPRKKVICPKCKSGPKKFTCVDCGTREKPLKNSRKKTFLCKVCRVEQKALNKLKSSKEKIDVSEIINYLLEKDFLLSTTGIPYKFYGGIRVSVGSTCDIPLIVVKQASNDIQCYNGRTVEAVLPDEAICDLKPVINTIGALWEK